MSLLHKLVEVCQVAEDRVNIRVVADVVAKVQHRGWVEGTDPDGLDINGSQIVELGGDT